MSSTEAAIRTGPTTLQALARRHLWMHFTRLSAQVKVSREHVAAKAALKAAPGTP